MPDQLTVIALPKPGAVAFPARRGDRVAPLPQLEETEVETVFQLDDMVEAGIMTEADGDEGRLVVRIAGRAVEQAAAQGGVVGHPPFADRAQAGDREDRRRGLGIVGTDAGR